MNGRHPDDAEWITIIIIFMNKNGFAGFNRAISIIGWFCLDIFEPLKVNFHVVTTQIDGLAENYCLLDYAHTTVS